MLDASLTAPLDAAARAVASAELAEAAARAPAREAEAEMEALDERIRSADTAKAEIKARRASGDARDGDAGIVGLLDMDREGLIELRARAAAAAQAAGETLTAAARATINAQSALARTERRITYTALHERMLHLLKLAAVAQEAVSAALAELDPQDGVQARLNVAENARGVGVLMLKAALDVRGFDETLRAGGMRVSRPIWGPSDDLNNALVYLRMNAAPER